MTSNEPRPPPGRRSSPLQLLLWGAAIGATIGCSVAYAGGLGAYGCCHHAGDDTALLFGFASLGGFIGAVLGTVVAVVRDW